MSGCDQTGPVSVVCVIKAGDCQNLEEVQRRRHIRIYTMYTQWWQAAAVVPKQRSTSGHPIGSGWGTLVSGPPSVAAEGNTDLSLSWDEGLSTTIPYCFDFGFSLSTELFHYSILSSSWSEKEWVSISLLPPSLERLGLLYDYIAPCDCTTAIVSTSLTCCHLLWWWGWIWGGRERPPAADQVW